MTPPRTGFTDPEGLRCLLNRLHTAGRGAWRHDREASELMRFTADRYAALARKYGMEPDDAAAAAFEAMLTASVRTAQNPWAVITQAVRITLIAENRAQGLLCSVHQARRAQFSVFHDAERFSDRENPLTDYHPVFRTPPPELPDGHDDSDGPEVRASAVTAVGSAVEDTIGLFILLGWPAGTARTGVDYICARLSESGNRSSAYERLRRDQQARALLDLGQDSWIAMLRVVLGSPHPDRTHTAAGRGVLVRLLIGHTVADLLGEDDIVLAVSLAAPPAASGGCHG